MKQFFNKNTNFYKLRISIEILLKIKISKIHKFLM